jgi:hypothetical protein
VTPITRGEWNCLMGAPPRDSRVGSVGGAGSMGTLGAGWFNTRRVEIC